MRKSKAETAKTRQRIVEVAAEAIRTKGIDATGVAEVMAAAGLTHGGFYRHFDSKEALVAEALQMSRADYLAATVQAAEQGPHALLEHFRNYVSPANRDDVGGSCALAANGSEIVRSDAITRRQATESLKLWFDKAAPHMRGMDEESKSELAISLITNMIGALTMARMVDDPALSEQILKAARDRIDETFAVAES